MTQERDLRKYAKSTQIRLVVGVLMLIFILGDGLIYWFYGKEAGTLAFLCTVLGLSPIILIAFFLWLFGRIVRGARNE